MLSITCDNVSVNDVLIAEFAKSVDEFPGEANQTHCFTHILSLVAKSITKMFDAPKRNAVAGEEGSTD